MKWLKFIRYVIQHGTLRAEPVDFEGERIRVLGLNDKRPAVHGKLSMHPVKYMIRSNLGYLRKASDMNKMFFVSERHRLVYLRILKCASTSMLRGFLPLVDEKYVTSSLSAAQIDAQAFSVRRSELMPHERGYKKFVVVRNPFHRLVSVYLDLFDPAAAVFPYHTYCFGILRSDMTFPAFVKAIATVPLVLMGPHFAPQTYVLKQSGFLASGDVSLFRLDMDAALLESFVAAYGFALGDLNRNPESTDYRKFYDAESFQIVQRLYAQDISDLGYSEEARELGEWLTRS